MKPMIKKLPFSGLVSATFIFAIPFLAWAGSITTDGTTRMGAASSLTGPKYAIPQSLGTTVGNNLFHSFGVFNLNQGDIATFTGANTLQNIISRVTGGSPSSIDGTIQSKIGNANFFFINPAGVIFGEHAVVDVPAAFHVSTAQELRFSDGARFSAVMPAGSSFTSAPPEAFGFLGPSGVVQFNKSQLTFKDGSAVTFSAGSVTSDGATLKVPRGSLRIYGQGDTVGAVPMSGDLPAGNGAVTIKGGGLSGHDNPIDDIGTLDTSGDGAGNIGIGGAAVHITDSATAYNHNTGAKDAEGKIHIDANSLLIDNASMKSRAYSSGKAGDVTVNVNSDMWVKNNGGVSSSSYESNSTGKAGNVQINTSGNLYVMKGGSIGSVTSGQGDAGTVTVTAGNLTIDSKRFTKGLTGISSSANPDSTGKAGDVVVNVSGEMQALNGGAVTSDTFASGDAGTVTVTAMRLTVDRAHITSGAYEGTGKAGSVKVKVSGEMQVLNGGEVASDTFTSKDAGTVTVTTGNLTIDSKGYTKFGTGISSSANSSTGKAGSVKIKVTGEMQVLNGGSVLSSTFAQGDAGTVTVTTGNLTIDGKGYTESETGISSSTNPGSTGKAGGVLVNVSGEMQVLNGGTVASATLGKGDAGTVTVTAGSLTIDSKGHTGSLTGISSLANPGSTGKAGTVNVTVIGCAQLRGDPTNLNSAISSANLGTRDAGAVNVSVGGRLSLTGTTIETSAQSGKGGPIHIDAPLLDLANSRITTSVETGGNAGDITVRGKYLVMDTGFIQANTTEQGATGGNILIDELGVIGKSGVVSVGGLEHETFVIRSGKNIIQAAAPGGVSGNVTLTSPDTSTATGMAAVGDRHLEMNPVGNPCYGNKKRASLRIKGRGRLPASLKECVWSAIPRTMVP